MRHALDLKAASGGAGRLLAGGQSLVAAMNMRLTTGDMLVDSSRLTELAGVADAGDSLRIGALTRHAKIGRDGLIAAHAPLLADAVAQIAHTAIRNRGTVGGALALGATLRVEGPGGARDVAAADFLTGLFETAIRPGEMLTAISVPKAGGGERQVLADAARRAGDYALAGPCLVQRGAAHRIAPVSVGPTPVLATAAMAAPNAGDLTGAVTALQGEIDPPSDTQASAAYRRHLAGVLLRRTVGQLEGEEE